LDSWSSPPDVATELITPSTSRVSIIILIVSAPTCPDEPEDSASIGTITYKLPARIILSSVVRNVILSPELVVFCLNKQKIK